MKSSTATLAGLALVASMAGCAMCQNPYDFCGPVTDANGCPNCDFGARRGSMFHPMDGTPPTTPLTPTPAAASETRKAPIPDDSMDAPPAYNDSDFNTDSDSDSFR